MVMGLNLHWLGTSCQTAIKTVVLLQMQFILEGGQYLNIRGVHTGHTIFFNSSVKLSSQKQPKVTCLICH